MQRRAADRQRSLPARTLSSRVTLPKTQPQGAPSAPEACRNPAERPRADAGEGSSTRQSRHATVALYQRVRAQRTEAGSDHQAANAIGQSRRERDIRESLDVELVNTVDPGLLQVMESVASFVAAAGDGATSVLSERQLIRMCTPPNHIEATLLQTVHRLDQTGSPRAPSVVEHN